MLNKMIPVLIIHGDKDHTIDVSHSTNLKKDRQANTALVVIKGKHHGDFSTEELAKQLGVFLTDVLSDAKKGNSVDSKAEEENAEEENAEEENAVGSPAPAKLPGNILLNPIKTGE